MLIECSISDIRLDDGNVFKAFGTIGREKSCLEYTVNRLVIVFGMKKRDDLEIGC